MTSQEEERCSVRNLQLATLQTVPAPEPPHASCHYMGLSFQGGWYFRNLFYYDSLTLVCGENILFPVVSISSEMYISFIPAAVRGWNAEISLLYYAAIFIFRIFNNTISSQMLQTRCKTKVEFSVSSSKSTQKFTDDRHKWLIKLCLRFWEFTRPFTPASFSWKMFRLHVNCVTLLACSWYLVTSRFSDIELLLVDFTSRMPYKRKLTNGNTDWLTN